MQNTLLTYFNKRFGREDLHEKKKSDPGPVITISRQVGCNGVKLATKMADTLNEHPAFSTWKVLSKEIFYESARELNMEPEKIRRIFKQDESYALNDIINAIGSRRFKSEKKITKTVREIIFSFAIDGYCIIVGRAAHIIACSIKNALHVRLYAPLEYRIKTIMENNRLNREEAIEFINKVEKERIAFRNTIGEISMENDLFDIFINRASFNDEDTINLIREAATKKGIFKDYLDLPHFYP
jgi:cytidylate kinase